MQSKLFSFIDQELARQEACINLIASENYTSKAIMHLTGSLLTNKYAEGYPGRRYYAGCEFVDKVENFALEQCNMLFHAEHSNVQPHSGSNANSAVYLATLKTGDTIVAMNLAAGGHLTHGHPINFSGKQYKFVHYGVNKETERIDYEEIARLVEQSKPKLVIAGTSAYARLINYAKVADIAQSYGALFMYDMAHISGLVAAEVVPTPVGIADIITSTTHKTLRGPRGGIILSRKKLGKAIDKAVMPGTQGGPLMHVIAAKGLAFELARKPEFKEYQKQVLKNSQIMAETFQSLGYKLVTDGTDTHLLIVDLRTLPNGRSKINGKIAEEALEKCGIILNRNMVPFDTESPLITSGVRIGSAAITTRGMKEKEAQEIVYLIDEAWTAHDNDAQLKLIAQRVALLSKAFPVYKACPADSKVYSSCSVI